MNKDKQYLSVVNGNDFTLNMHVTRWNADNQSFIDYRMDNCSQVVCFLVAVTGGRRYKLPISIDGNILTADIDGSMLNVGVYGLELLFEDAESKSKRSYEPALIKIVRTNAEATYTQADFDSEDDCRLHITVQTNASFITIGAPTADTQIDGTSYNAVSNAAVTEAINNLQQQIDTIGSEILDPASVYTKSETEALIDEMIDPQELADYVTNAVSYYTTTEQFDNSYNSLSERITAIENNPTDISHLVSYDYLSQQAYLQSSALDGLATQAYVDEKVAAVDVSDQLADFVSKEELNSASYLQSDDLNGLATESYVVDKINSIAPTDISGLVSYEFLTSQAYLQADAISDVVRDSDLASAGYITTQDVSAMGYASTQFVTEQIAAIPQPDLSTYITETELNDTLSSYAQLADLISNERVVSTALNSLADRIETVEGDYVSDTELDEALLPFATESYVVEKISGITPTDMSSYVTKTELNAAGYITPNDISDVVRDSDLASAGYLTAEDVAEMGYATQSYVAEKIDSISPADLTEYVSKTFLSQQSYLQADDISDVVRDSDLASAGYLTAEDVAEMGYLTESDLAGAGYLTESDLASAGYVTATELSNAGYVTATDLSSAGYVTATDLSSAGYVTATDLSSAGYVTATEISNAGYITEAELSNAGYITETELSNAGYITETELSNAGYVTATDLSSAGYVTSTEISTAGYVTSTEISNAGYVTSTEISNAGYITANDVAQMGYVTDSDLNTALSSYAKVSDIEANEQVISAALNTLSDRIDDLEGAGYITTTDMPYKFVVISYADYTALSYKDPQTFYCIPE